MTTETIRARPTTYNGIKMRSRLEAAFAQMLDKQDVSWRYEPECFASPSGQYLPDFQTDGDYWEVKPTSILDDGSAFITALERMQIIWASKPSARLALAVFDYEKVVTCCTTRRDHKWFLLWGTKPSLIKAELTWGQS